MQGLDEGCATADEGDENGFVTALWHAYRVYQTAAKRLSCNGFATLSEAPEPRGGAPGADRLLFVAPAVRFILLLMRLIRTGSIAGARAA
jgi:hypothetical protein